MAPPAVAGGRGKASAVNTGRRSPGGAIHADLRWLGFAALLFIAAASLGAIVLERLPPLDVAVLATFRGLRESALWPLFAAANLVGSPAIWVTTVVAVAAVVATRRSTIWLAVPAAMIAAEIVTVAFKLVVDRPRPPGVVIVDLVTDASYPSGHVARAAATALATLLVAWPALRRRGRRARVGTVVAAALTVVVMGVARLAAGEHWLTDVVGAILVSGSVVAATAALLPRPPAPESGPRVAPTAR
jgi:undecaprenyl-diphosphatase